MSELSLTVVEADGTEERRDVSIDRLVNCGYTGRSEADVRQHIEELEAEGVPAPETFPTAYPKPSQLLATGRDIEVVTDRTSGEAEFVLLPQGKETYVGVGSDHTDRELEETDVLRSKAVCPNVVGDTVWRLDDVADHWDDLVLRSWIGTGTDRSRYQHATLAEIRPPEELLSFVDDRSHAPLADTAVFSGSVPVESGELVYADTFAVELFDPVLDRSLSVEYGVEELDWLE
jgi:hypothetical protein